MKNSLFLFLMLPLLSFSQLSDQQQHDIISLKQEIKTAQHDSVIVKSWIAWDNIIYTSDSDLDFRLNTQIDSLCSINLKKQLTNKEKRFFQESISFANNSLGIIFTEKGDHVQAIDYYTKALKINEKLGLKKQISKCLGNIGVIYYDQSDFDKAMEYANRSFAIRTELGDSSGMVNSLHNIAGIYNALGEEDKALEYNQRGLAVAKRIGNKRSMPGCLMGIGGFHASKKDYSKARDYYDQSLQISKELGHKQGISNAYMKIGELYKEQGNYATSNKYHKLALDLAQEIGFPQIIRESSRTLSENYKKQGLFKESLVMYELFVATRDSIVSDNNKKETIRQEFKYSYEKRSDSMAIEQRKKDELASIDAKRKEDNAQRENEKKNIIIGSVLSGLLLVIVFTVFVINRLRVTKKQNIVIEEQKLEVEKSRDETAQQKLVIEEAHAEITGSINYAKRLQDAILPSKEDVTNSFQNSFVFFQPKDVVSGDFYWFEQQGNFSYLAVADCTGHGVPGALVSVVCSNALNRSVREFGISDPSKILDKSRELVIETFAKSGADVKDGMDIALYKFDESNKQVTFAGANNPLWIVRKTNLLNEEQKNTRSTVIGEDFSLVEFKANKQPIGLYENMIDFTQEVIQLLPEDQLYLFSDGFADQFGGEKGKKFKYKPFKQLLIDIRSASINEQALLLSDTFEQWKGELEQVDDVCVIGVQFDN